MNDQLMGPTVRSAPGAGRPGPARAVKENPAVGRPFAAGLDVGARLLHLVVVDRAGRVLLARTFPAGDLAATLPVEDQGLWVAVDAPDRQRPSHHLDDARLGAKFRGARCAEVALGVERRYWVPWVTPPPGQSCSEWMRTGFEVWATLAELGLRGLEVYPYAAFRTLGRGARLARKQTPEGVGQRVALLGRAGLEAEGLEGWSHDLLDAAVAALVARGARLGTADEVRCSDHDEPGIWLPRPAGEDSPDRAGV